MCDGHDAEHDKPRFELTRDTPAHSDFFYLSVVDLRPLPTTPGRLSFGPLL